MPPAARTATIAEVGPGDGFPFSQDTIELGADGDQDVVFKDRLVDELRPVFAEIPSSAVREELIERVAACLELPATLLSAWMPQPASHQPTGELSPRVRDQRVAVPP
ncbi:MAG TPA: hypothetical protein VMY78_08995 [Solirubrobacteraceae bacterium]|nr:hypothetical protein [Solirubrobacteraceae bacterium]